VENQKVVDIIKAGLAWANWDDDQKEAFIIAGQAVEKQIPQKVIKIVGVSSQACPGCRSNANGKYCSSCGQKLSY
jgi:hypothetical protein